MVRAFVCETASTVRDKEYKEKCLLSSNRLLFRGFLFFFFFFWVWEFRDLRFISLIKKL